MAASIRSARGGPAEAGERDCLLRFQNQWDDVESGLHYNLHRHYDPDTGQYASPDPIGLAGGPRTHAYVHDPLGWVDPFGLAPCFTGGANRAANKGFPGVGTTPNGGPTFEETPYMYPAGTGQKSRVNITLTGSRSADFAAANEAGGFSEQPDNYTWHHVDDFDQSSGQSSMELVQSDAHQATFPHKGSAGQYQDYNGVKYGR